MQSVTIVKDGLRHNKWWYSEVQLQNMCRVVGRSDLMSRRGWCSCESVIPTQRSRKKIANHLLSYVLILDPYYPDLSIPENVGLVNQSYTIYCWTPYCMSWTLLQIGTQGKSVEGRIVIERSFWTLTCLSVKSNWTTHKSVNVNNSIEILLALLVNNQQ